VCLHNVLADGQAQPRAARFAGAALINSIKPFEDAGLVFRSDAGPVVAHGDAHRTAAFDQRNHHAAFLTTILNSVVNQVNEHLTDAVAVSHYQQAGFGQRGRKQLEVDAALGGLLLQ